MPGLFSRFLGKALPAPASRTQTITVYSGNETLEVVGESYRQDVLWRFVGGRSSEPVRAEIVAVLVPTDDNEHDPNAVEVQISNELVGYLSRSDAVAYRPGLLALMASEGMLIGLHGVIVGGGPRSDGIGYLGVFLDHDPADFGLASHHVSIGRLRTGFSEAVATDLADDSYDLSWYHQLPANDATAIQRLRVLLKDERDPIDRHYMLCELEHRLYASRNAFASALDEFDAACSQHHEEMVTIRPALLTKFEVIPVVEMYRQAVIRCQKAKQWEAAREWAERGVELYADQAARPEVVEDLHKRIAYATEKLEAATRPKPQRPRRSTVSVAASASTTETLVCTVCRASFERVRTRGRKPHTCPTCREAAESPAVAAM
ncbi:MAG: hypothetical protein QOH16_3868 [Gaiellaceae bacterium]|nr:hypothetical protein [Gaiellaceae bacterium]